MDGSGKSKVGYNKIRFCGKQASHDGLQYFWYRNATKCYVYLSDVTINDPDLECRLFTRIKFFCSNSKRLGDRNSLEGQIHEITGITISALRGASPSSFSIEERFSWVNKRQTKRAEDKAYSLLGIFNIYMPLLHGEGEQRALNRLAEEVHKHTTKRSRDEVERAFLNPAKRLKTLQGNPSSIPSNHNLDPESPYYSVHCIDATTKDSLIDLLYFTKIDERLTSLTAAQGKTCRWFFTKPEYISWHDVAQQRDHGGFLWIKGHPGTGKSTLMKLLFEEAKINAKSNSSQLTPSFFFLARGTVEEKSTTGLYRSLLHQLFEKAVELKESLDWRTTDGARGIQRNGWNEEALKQTLTHTIQKLGARSLTIFVDALDECDIKQTTGMVSFFEELCDYARDAQVQLQICFSSRHYPTVVIQKGVEVTLEEEIGHTEDIEQYIKLKLRLGKSTQAESFRSKILQKSSGIFLWVVLVLDILNSEYPNKPISIKRIHERLEEIPPELYDLFEMIIKRDGENIKQLKVCLKWILFSTRPLTPQELYFAIQLSLNKECSSYWDQEDGLDEVTWNMASQVQFIHESVRDFLVDKYKGELSGSSGNFIGHGHELLRDCCLAQLNASISQDVDLPDPLPKASKAAHLRENISLNFPFLKYSVFNVLCHANIAYQNSMGQEDFRTNFPLQRWIFLNNLLEKFDVRRYTESASLLYILAEKDLADLIRIHHQRESYFDIENERYGPPIFAALATGSDDAARTFLEVQVESQPPSSSLLGMLKDHCHIGHKRDSFGHDFTFSKRRGIESYLAEHGNEIVLAFYLEKRLDVNSKDEQGRTPLSWAARNGHEATVKQLVAVEGVDVDSKDQWGQTPLLWAARNGHEAIVKLLVVVEGVDVDSNDQHGQTLLSWVAMNRYGAIVKLLVAVEGVDVDSKDQWGQTPLLWAARNGHEAIVKLLVAVEGVAVDSKDQRGQTPLSWAARTGHKAIVKLLVAATAVPVVPLASYDESPSLIEAPFPLLSSVPSCENP
ncbi:hypothetical protein BJ875DRAFT_508254 [Amylocarpus encephaloides]|uniref:Nephrocystin 3-like N-terminal domain-containing protein n=1 Tax=Amylocarpus encephaloides TaxID=45428 RepID=A0A9P7Y948_9HELO|nr:hypothetical protein BJ875DRAFT_508254 [Amylocarpus encephaloides]